MYYTMEEKKRTSPGVVGEKKQGGTGGGGGAGGVPGQQQGRSFHGSFKGRGQRSPAGGGWTGQQQGERRPRQFHQESEYTGYEGYWQEQAMDANPYGQTNPYVQAEDPRMMYKQMSPPGGMPYNKQFMQTMMGQLQLQDMMQQQMLQQQMIGYPTGPGMMLPPQAMPGPPGMIMGPYSPAMPFSPGYSPEYGYEQHAGGAQGEYHPGGYFQGDQRYEHHTNYREDPHHHHREERRGRDHHGKFKTAEDMSEEDLRKSSSPMLTRIIVDMLRDGEEGKSRAWHFFERLCQLSKADVYQYSVMLNACADSWAAGKLMDRMERAGVQPSEVTFQKLYKIFLRDARVSEADEVLQKMNELMEEDGNSKLPDDYTNRVLTDMLLEMIKEGNQAEKRAWELFNKLRVANKVNVIHYNVMLNTCKTTEDAIKLVQQARQAGITPSDRTCLKLAKMYIKEGNMPSHPHQLDAVMKGLKKTILFSGEGSADSTISPGPAAPEQALAEVTSANGPDAGVTSSTSVSPTLSGSTSGQHTEEEAVAKMVEQMLLGKYGTSGARDMHQAKNPDASDHVTAGAQGKDVGSHDGTDISTKVAPAGSIAADAK